MNRVGELRTVKKAFQAAAILVAMLGCSTGVITTTTSSTPTTAPTTTTIPPPMGGHLSLSVADMEDGCTRGRGEFDDIYMGANVVVRDGSGIVIGSTDLGRGLLDPDAMVCRFLFSLRVPRTADFYTVEIAGRPGPVYSHQQMENMLWLLDLSLGQ